MKQFYLLIIALFTQFIINAQYLDDRLEVNHNLAPFYHGVASGDPTEDAVVIWTRVSPQDPVTEVNVKWRMATDKEMRNIVASGTFITNAERDFTVKLDVQGLAPYTTYYYDFEALGQHSIIGRTKTVPTADEADNLRFAIVACSSLEHGFFNAYQHIVNRNDIDAVVHLGDYIYEYAVGGYGNNIEGRTYLPENEIVSLDDYRLRYSRYRIDAPLRNIHQQYPFITTWDDHEFTDNAYKTGANNHQPATEGDWEERKLNALKAYKEWMPVRDFEYTKIYRTMHYGNLVDLHVLDTRVSERDEQAQTGDVVEINNADRKLIGDEQFNWLTNAMETSKAQWQVVAQQIMMAPLRVAGVPINTDQWDGYEAERSRLLDFVDASSNIKNFVVLTGDIHTSWAMDIPKNLLYEPISYLGSVGSEFVCTSVTSPGLDIPLAADVIKLNNPHMKYVDLQQKGYMILDVDANSTQADWYYTAVNVDGAEESLGASYLTMDGNNYVEEADGPAEPTVVYPDPAPEEPIGGFNSVAESIDILVFGVYPNPFNNQLIVQYNLDVQGAVSIKVVDVNGRVFISETKNNLMTGVNYMKINTTELAQGTYTVLLEVNGQVSGKTVIKK